MFSLFRKKTTTADELKFADIDGSPLQEGDLVQAMRYELGRCRIVKTDQGLVYESLEDGRQVSWTKMIDAATRNQKVRKS